jgi:hypothetical protein
MVEKFKMMIALTSILFTSQLSAQDDDFDLLGEEKPVATKVNYAFKTTKVINLQSTEVTDKGVLDFKMMHRFGPTNAGPYEAFGLDQSTVRFGFEYGVTRSTMISAGRSNVNGLKNLDFFVKQRLLHQNSTNSLPVSVLAVVGTQYLSGSKFNDLTNQERSAYFAQLIIARKFDEDFTLEIVPTWLYNAKNPPTMPSLETPAVSQMALGVGLRHKISPRSSINLEYIPVLTNKGTLVNSFSVGMDVETGGHVFQFHLTNSPGLNEVQFISNTTDPWKTGGIRFGFNLSRVFTVVKPKAFKK